MGSQSEGDQVTVARWTSRLRQIDDSGKEAGVPTDKADKMASVSSVSTAPPLFAGLTPLPGAVGADDLPLDPLAASALAKLVIDQALRRAAVAEPTAKDYRIGVALRVPAGGYATAVLMVPTSVGFAIFNAMRRTMQ
jgi:hypothetical protein